MRLGILAFALLATGCARLVDFEPTVNGSVSDPAEQTDQGGSAKPSGPKSDAQLPAPPPEDCGDKASDAANCGYCGHVCKTGSCSEGLCASEQVVQQSKSIDAFVTDGLSLFLISNASGVRCDAAGPGSQTCASIIEKNQLPDHESSGGGGQGGMMGRPHGPKGNGDEPPKTIKARGLALGSDRIVMTDDANHYVISCPVAAVCTFDNVGILDTSEGEETPDFGKTLAIGSNSITWTQGDALFSSSTPNEGFTITSNEFTMRNEIDTQDTQRVLTPDSTFWLSASGLHKGDSLAGNVQQWSEKKGDFAIGTLGIYLANSSGLYQLGRTTKMESVVVEGSYTHVVTDERGVYATLAEGGVTKVVDVRQGKPLLLAVVAGEISALAAAGDHVYYTTNVSGEIRRVSR